MFKYRFDRDLDKSFKDEFKFAKAGKYRNSHFEGKLWFLCDNGEEVNFHIHGFSIQHRNRSMFTKDGWTMYSEAGLADFRFLGTSKQI